jgi:hypothetical protein
MSEQPPRSWTGLRSTFRQETEPEPKLIEIVNGKAQTILLGTLTARWVRARTSPGGVYVVTFTPPPYDRQPITPYEVEITAQRLRGSSWISPLGIDPYCGTRQFARVRDAIRVIAMNALPDKGDTR